MKTDKLNQHTRSLNKTRNDKLLELKRKMGMVQEVPAGWLTCNQIAERINATPRTALNHIHEWMKVGKCELRKFSTRTGIGDLRRVAHYRFDPEVAKALELE